MLSGVHGRIVAPVVGASKDIECYFTLPIKYIMGLVILLVRQIMHGIKI